MNNLLMLAAMLGEGRGGGGFGGLLVWLLTTAGLWTMFVKAGQPGWAAVIPIYNLYVLFKIAGKSFWWLLLLLVPVVNLVVLFLVTMAVATRFGKGFLFGLGMLFLPFVFYPMLGFGSSTYRAHG